MVLIGGLVGVTACSAPGSNNDANARIDRQRDQRGRADVRHGRRSPLKTTSRPASRCPKALTDEFTKQYPNVKWNIREDQFAVITANAPRALIDNPPDLMRLPQLSELWPRTD